MKLIKNRPYFSSLIMMLSIGIILVVSKQKVFGQTVIKKWKIQSASYVQERGDIISQVNYNDTTWYPATGASTVLAALVKNGVYPDPYYGTNLAKIPGSRLGIIIDWICQKVVPSMYTGGIVLNSHFL